MNYEEAVQSLFARRPKFFRFGLEIAQKFSAVIGNPEQSFPAVHVAGTNGKGSVTTKIAKALELAGLKVGLFTSPHLFSFRERITINGEQIPEAYVAENLEKLFAIAEKIDPEACFFEITTFLAFQYFKEQNIDIAVIEAGIGGLCDTTNIITPLVSVITSIAHDHADILGRTIEEIAAQKAGIIKHQVPAVIGPYADYPPIHVRAASCQSPLYFTPTVPGFYDWENTAIARQALNLLRDRYPLTDEIIEQGLVVRPVCRFERIGNVIFDVAHNPDCFHRLLEAMETHYPSQPFTAIIGMSKDKDVKTSLEILSQKADHIYLVQGATPRAASVAEMKEILSQINYPRYTAGKTVKECLELTHDRLVQGRLVVVCGTFYIMQEAREHVVGVQVGAK
jgi:dihydrofolate synthase/folylpolyglutamate synthase